MEETMADDGGRGELFEKGLAMRRAVLGAEYVDRSIQNADAFTEPFQKLVNEWCWGEVWNRPGLDKKTRSLINLAMLTALNRPNEVRLHVRGALNNGVTREEIQDVLLAHDGILRRAGRPRKLPHRLRGSQGGGRQIALSPEKP
jgi:4-carboxymuconolactone decarboxylase